MIGNCQISALVSNDASIDWCCFPRPDSPPLFAKLLDKNAGHFKIAPASSMQLSQQYIENTNILETIFFDDKGNSFAVVDFAPRFEQYGRYYRPNMIIRIVRVISGSPKIKVTCNPTKGWSKEIIPMRRGNSHIQFVGLEDELRLSTNMPLTYLIDNIPSDIPQTYYFALSWGLPVEDNLPATCESFLLKTMHYWQSWVKHCSIPSGFQQQSIRSALVLKLHCYEDTGAILASITTSLPEELGGVRNWDYRFCWLRDACFTVSALYRLGHYEELEGLLRFISNVVSSDAKGDLRPVYRLDGTLPLPEEELSTWKGYEKSLPVRVGNQAAEHVQNDVYGEILLILAPIYFDDRFSDMRADKYSSLFQLLASRAHRSLHEADAGLWEHRNGWKRHSFTLLMSWAGLDRYSKLLSSGRIQGRLEDIQRWCAEAAAEVRVSAENDVVFNSPDDKSPDAAMLLLPILRFVDDKINKTTVLYLRDQLGINEADSELKVFMYRYKRNDDFGNPKHAFLICTYWLVEALVRIGEIQEAKDILTRATRAANHLGLLSEHFDTENARQTGNFPQCYSHVGQLNAAFATSASWDEIL
jgi:GH15 family glucan-1,4-alpha-glucosidase